jgi:hypothetical protein
MSESTLVEADFHREVNELVGGPNGNTLAAG